MQKFIHQTEFDVEDIPSGSKIYGPYLNLKVSNDNIKEIKEEICLKKV